MSYGVCSNCNYGDYSHSPSCGECAYIEINALENKIKDLEDDNKLLRRALGLACDYLKEAYNDDEAREANYWIEKAK